MSNPNNPDKRAADKKAKAAEAAFLADTAEAQAKAAEAEKIGTAEKPVEAGLNLGSVPSTDNIKAKWADEISAIALKFKKNDTARLLVWREMGAKLNIIGAKFVKYDENGKPRKGTDGKVIQDNNEYNKWLVAAGLTKEELSNPNTRSAARWIASNWEEVQKVPAAMKHAHPVHAKDAYKLFTGALDAAKAAYEGEDFDAAKFAADYEAPKANGKGGTVPHSVDTYLRTLRAALSSNKPGVTIHTLPAKGANEFTALIILLREVLTKTEKQLSIAESEVARLTLDIADADAALVAAGLSVTPKAKRTRKPKAKTENGDEIVPGEVELWQGRDSEADEIDGDFEEVKPAQGLLPPPDKDAGADADADETL